MPPFFIIKCFNEKNIFLISSGSIAPFESAKYMMSVFVSTNSFTNSFNSLWPRRLTRIKLVLIAILYFDKELTISFTRSKLFFVTVNRTIPIRLSARISAVDWEKFSGLIITENFPSQFRISPLVRKSMYSESHFSTPESLEILPR